MTASPCCMLRVDSAFVEQLVLVLIWLFCNEITLLHLFCLSDEDTYRARDASSLPSNVLEFPHPKPQEWTFQTFSEIDATSLRTNRPKQKRWGTNSDKKKTAGIQTDRLNFIGNLFSLLFFCLQDLVDHLNSSYNRCITTVPEDDTRIILHKREEKQLWLHYFIIYKHVKFYSIMNPVPPPLPVLRARIMRQICTLRLWRSFEASMGGGKKRKKPAAKRRLRNKGWEYLSRQLGWVRTSHTIPKSVLKNEKCKRQTIGLGRLRIPVRNSGWLTLPPPSHHTFANHTVQKFKVQTWIGISWYMHLIFWEIIKCMFAFVQSGCVSMVQTSALSSIHAGQPPMTEDIC